MLVVSVFLFPFWLDMGLLPAESFRTEEVESSEVIICGWHHAVINDYCVYHKTSTWTIYFSLAQGTSIQLSEIIYRADPLG